MSPTRRAIVLAIACVLSVFLLVAAFYAARPAPHPVRWGVFGWTATLIIAGPILIQAFVTVAAIFAVSLGIALAVWPRVRHQVRSFVPLAGAALVVAYGLAGWAATGTMARYDRLREQYPYESMEDRVPAPRPAVSGPTAADGPLVSIESELDHAGGGLRVWSLRQLHEERVRLFINSPGFGVRRVMGPEWGLRYWPREGRTEQPGSIAPPTTDPRPPDHPLSAADEPGLLSLHNQGLLDFVNPRGFGYVKDRRHVAGFVAHGFSDAPPGAPRWAVERIDLIGLLVHPEPVAYVSDQLPAMDELRGAPTRALDAFEAAALDALRGGQTLYLGPPGERPRMLGAIRSARQCVGCHGGDRGDLLGAFSYSLSAR